MKMLLGLALPLALSALITGCTDTPTAPEGASTVTAETLLVSPAPTLWKATRYSMPFDFIRSGDCTGELVEISGTIHLVTQIQSDGSIVGHFNYQEVTGMGLTSGSVYRASAVDHFRLSAPFPSSITSTTGFHLISQGSDGNLLVTVLYHITVNGN